MASAAVDAGRHGKLARCWELAYLRVAKVSEANTVVGS